MQPMRVEKLREMVEAEYARALQDPAVMEAVEATPIPAPPNLYVEPEQEPPSPLDILSAPSGPSVPSAQANAVEEGLDELLDRKEIGGNGPQPLVGDEQDGMIPPSGPHYFNTPDDSLNESREEDGDGMSLLQSIGENPVFGNIPWKYEQGTVRKRDECSSRVAVLLRMACVFCLLQPTSLASLTRSETPYSLPSNVVSLIESVL